ncbi:ABC transporter permease subunit [bacterium AH-315-P15]|nr:ABC transporter permease subunit [bacterium AH-315-P15]
MTDQTIGRGVGKVTEIKGRSLWDDARRRLFANKAAVTSMILLVLMILMAIIGPSLSPHDIRDQNYAYTSGAPSLSAPTEEGGTTIYLFGTDANGRDIFSRTWFGARISLAIGFIATSVSLMIGVIYGATAGFIGGRLDNLMMRFVDVLYSIPFMFIVIILMVIFGRTGGWQNILLLFAVIGAVEWLTMARIVRGQTLSIKQKEFIEAAEAAGVGRGTIIRRHIVPNVLGPVVIYVTLTIPAVILTESFLSFLGLGVQEPFTSWGRLIAEGAQEINTAPWMLAFPALLMAITLFCFNFIGDGLRDALDPKDR